MDELIPYQEPKLPLAKHVELNNLGEIIKLQPITPLDKRFSPVIKSSKKIEVKLPPPQPKIKVTPSPLKPKVTIREPLVLTDEPDEATRMERLKDMIVAMISVLSGDGGGMREIVAVLLNEFEDFPKPILDYLAGGFYMGGNPKYDSRPPEWLLTAVSAERVKLAFEENKNNTIGTLACPADVLAALHPPAYLMNCDPVYTEIYKWCMYQVMPTYAPHLMGGLLMSYPPRYESIRYEYEELAALVRRKIVESSELSPKRDRKKKRKKSR
jgi:hypothetical protein